MHAKVWPVRVWKIAKFEGMVGSCGESHAARRSVLFRSARGSS